MSEQILLNIAGVNKRVKGVWPYQYRLPVRPQFERVWIEKK